MFICTFGSLSDPMTHVPLALSTLLLPLPPPPPPSRSSSSSLSLLSLPGVRPCASWCAITHGAQQPNGIRRFGLHEAMLCICRFELEGFVMCFLYGKCKISLSLSVKKLQNNVFILWPVQKRGEGLCMVLDEDAWSCTCRPDFSFTSNKINFIFLK